MFLGKRKKQINKYLISHEIKKLNIGCGLNILDGWLNTDIAPLSSEVVYMDATTKYPFQENSFDYVYSEHMFEHIEHVKGINMLKEVYKVLRPGGKIRISTPDMQFLIDLYNNDKTEVQNEYIKWSMAKYWPDINQLNDTYVINNFFYNFHHRFIYDFKTIQYLFNQVGFINVIKTEIGESVDENLRNIESHGNEIPEKFNELESLVVEASKPK